ncbi:MFS transporter [Sphingomonas sp.]|uniref:MFS transporter n=1 Tax=Sphingomonas sp. TaxID=28214 RepID=UPI003D6C84C7
MSAQAQTASEGPPRDISIRVTVICFLIVMIDGYDSLMVGFIAPLIAKGWGLHAPDIGKLFAVCYVGAILGAVSMGPLADRLGRRPMLISALALAAVATALCATATSFEMLMLYRFISGIALGGALPAVSSLTAEHARPGKRSGTVTLMYIGFPTGAVVGGAITAGLLHLGWQNIFLWAAFACAFALGIALLLPETYRPRDTQAHRPVLQRLTSTFTEQFADGRLWPALTLWLGLFCLMLLVYFLVSWSPSILVASGATPGVAALAGVALNLGGIIGALCLAPAINRFGPYRPVAALIGMGTFAVAALGLNLHSTAATMTLLFLAGVAVMGGQLNFPAMTVELYPQHVRGAGSGWTVGMGRLGSIVGPLLGGVLIGAGLSSSALFLFAAIPALVACGALIAAYRFRSHAANRENFG